jgi:hypothetical protein
MTCPYSWVPTPSVRTDPGAAVPALFGVQTLEPSPPSRSTADDKQPAYDLLTGAGLRHARLRRLRLRRARLRRARLRRARLRRARLRRARLRRARLRRRPPATPTACDADRLRVSQLVTVDIGPTACGSLDRSRWTWCRPPAGSISVLAKPARGDAPLRLTPNRGSDLARVTLTPTGPVSADHRPYKLSHSTRCGVWRSRCSAEGLAKGQDT